MTPYAVIVPSEYQPFQFDEYGVYDSYEAASRVADELAECGVYARVIEYDWYDHPWSSQES